MGDVCLPFLGRDEPCWFVMFPVTYLQRRQITVVSPKTCEGHPLTKDGSFFSLNLLNPTKLFSMVAFHLASTLGYSAIFHHSMALAKMTPCDVPPVSWQSLATRMSLCVAAGSDFYDFTFYNLFIINYCTLIDPKLASQRLQLCLKVQF